MFALTVSLLGLNIVLCVGVYQLARIADALERKF